jgi:hypothetical protein
VQNPRDHLRVDRNGNRLFACAINYGWNLTGDANATSRILVELALTGSCDDCFSVFCCCNDSIFLSGTELSSAPFAAAPLEFDLLKSSELSPLRFN